MEKKNLMLRMDKEVIEKAKKLGVNISALTENVLRTETMVENNEIIPTEDIRKEYREIFENIIALMKKWSISQYLQIGEESVLEEISDSKGKIYRDELTHSYYLNPAGLIEHYIDEYEQTVSKWKLEDDWPIDTLFKSEKIIEKIVNMIYEEAQKNRLRFEELKILKNFLENLKNKKDGNAK